MLNDFVRKWDDERQSNKLLVFSQTKKILAIIEVMLKQLDIKFLRMDGDVILKSRMDIINKFNSTQSERL